jgi:hypothetical protein
MTADLHFDLSEAEDRRLLLCCIRSNELAIACVELNNNLHKMFDWFIDQNNLDTELAEKLDRLKVQIYEMLPNNLNELE